MVRSLWVRGFLLDFEVIFVGVRGYSISVCGFDLLKR